jgi:hypothetical protein
MVDTSWFDLFSTKVAGWAIIGYICLVAIMLVFIAGATMRGKRDQDSKERLK